ncbi:coiled-coil domain-containing protein 201-like isoform X2 [Hyaena hyaena]|uniref:coiled-coil domain-containing protein 201-like isoform X2 n=1 Tax=Hyaena hyaena TaxID=95912 RepID=UPI0019233AB9|nr:coiled-coil domain-containing protein 201-like isoform X2 [Hyaena hyaena]
MQVRTWVAQVRESTGPAARNAHRCGRNRPGGRPRGSARPRCVLRLRCHGAAGGHAQVGSRFSCRGGMEPGEQAAGLGSAAQDEAPPSEMSQPSPRKVLRHSTPQEATPCLHRRPPGYVPYCPGGSPLAESPVPTCLSWSPPSAQAGPGSMATLQNLQLSTVQASGAASGGPATDSDPWAPEEDPPTPTSVTWRQQQAESGGARSQPPHLRLPGLPNTTRKRKRDPKELVAVTERVRQWETRLLQDIEEATQHELTIEDD